MKATKIANATNKLAIIKTQTYFVFVEKLQINYFKKRKNENKLKIKKLSFTFIPMMKNKLKTKTH